MTEGATPTGFFGKLPSHGDFVRRSLAPELIKRWDRWLQDGLAASRQALGEDWLDCYLSSPIWRFCLSAGICGDNGWIGAMMPSVDRVGRYFPLTVATQVPAALGVFGPAASAGSWLTALEQVMLEALENERFAADAFAEKLAALGPLTPSPPTQSPQDPGSAKVDGFVAVPLADAAELPQAAGGLTDALAQRCWGGFSLWWSNGSSYVDPSARVYADLPATTVFWTLLSNERRLG